MCGAEAKDPKALNSLVKAMNANPDAVNRDLMTYKGVLSKLNAAKEMMKVRGWETSGCFLTFLASRQVSA